MRTIFPKENEGFEVLDTTPTQNSAESEVPKVKFPMTVRFRGKALATIYGRKKSRNSYRVAWHVAGKRQMASFGTYSAAKKHADKMAKDLYEGSQVTALHPAQARDALTALERLQTHFSLTGNRVSLLAAVSAYCEAAAKLGSRSLDEALNGYLTTVVTIKTKDLKVAIDEFLLAAEPKTVASDGQRSQLSSKYAYNRGLQLKRFASTFPTLPVCDLTQVHLETFISSLAMVKTSARNKRAAGSAKSRNHYRAAIRQFLQWAVRKDYLLSTHRLNEADAMHPEIANTAETSIYTTAEFKQLLEKADKSLLPIIAIAGLAGLRTAEILRLDWQDVWRIPGHIEITAGKAKTRQRRLVTTCPALAAWLKQFRSVTAGKLWDLHEVTFQQRIAALCAEANVTRKTNGLRHAFCSYHFALHANENLTAQQAGNSPNMIHAHYKGLATRKEAKAWFAVKPAKVDNIVDLPQKKFEAI